MNTDKTQWRDRTYNTGFLRIQITNKHINCPGVWVMHVREFGWNCVNMNIIDEATEEEAQEAAIAKAKAHLQRMLDSLNE